MYYSTHEDEVTEILTHLGYSANRIAKIAAALTLESGTMVSNAIDTAANAWAYYEEGNDKHDVACMFEYTDEAPNYDAVLGAYVEGAMSEFEALRNIY